MSTPRRRRPVRGSGPPSGTAAAEIPAWLTASDDLASAAPAGSREKRSIHAPSRPDDADGALSPS